jgi:4-aminobutyrate aminotransferase
MTAQPRSTPTSNPDFIARRDAAVPRGLAPAHPLCIARAKNAELWDIEGRRYIDFCSGIAVVNTGHCHPKVIEAVERQTARFNHTCFQLLGYEGYLRLAERLNALAPSHLPQKTLLMSTGAEAVENAVKIARAFTGRPGIIAFEGGFHGRTLLALGLTGKIDPYKRGFGPFPGDIYHAPYPCALHGVSVDDAIEGVERLLKTSIEAARVAAFIVEPVQGEGGYYPAPAMFLQRLRALADELDILLIADEIQTGIGRTGELFAIEHSGVVPDLITLAKGLGGGFPISAVVGRADVMDAIAPGGIGSTFAGNPLACAAALAVLDVIEDESLCERANEIGKHLLTHLGELARRHRAIAEVRGLGAMVALELCEDGDVRRPAAELTRALIAEARERGLLLLACGRYGNVVRLMMPLTIEQAILDEGLDLLAASLEAVAGPS